MVVALALLLPLSPVSDCVAAQVHVHQPRPTPHVRRKRPRSCIGDEIAVEDKLHERWARPCRLQQHRHTRVVHAPDHTQPNVRIPLAAICT